MVAGAPQLVLRADAGAEIGGGHVMRCLALAEAWQARGGRARIVGRCDPPLRELVEGSGVEVVPLTVEPALEEDVAITLAAIGQHGASAGWVAVDGYHFDSSYHRALRRAGAHLLVLDDDAQLSRYDTDVLLNQNLGAERLPYRTGPHTVRLLGTRYTLLRRDFLDSRRPAREPAQPGRRVLVTMGASDPTNVTPRAVRALRHVGVPDMEVRIVIGPLNPHRSAIEEEVRMTESHMALVQPGTTMSAQMNWADMALTAGGSTCWELAFMGVPMVVVAVAENQRRIGEALSRADAAVSLGWAEHVTEDAIAATVLEILSSVRRRACLSLRASELVDGRGGERVCDQLGRAGR